MLTEREIKRKARELVPDAVRVNHVVPLAYCLAKPRGRYAVFAKPPLPPCDDHIEIIQEWRSDKASVKRGALLQRVRQGDWVALAYVSTKSSGLWYCVHGYPRGEWEGK